MSCGMSSDENSLIFWKTIGTNSPNSPTMTIQIMSSVHRAASQRGTCSRRVLPMCSLLSRSVSGLADHRQHRRRQDIRDHVAEVPHEEQNHCRDDPCNDIPVYFRHLYKLGLKSRNVFISFLGERIPA